MQPSDRACFRGSGGLERCERPFTSINGGPQSPPFIFGLQCRPGLAGRQPRIEEYSGRLAMARQIVVPPVVAASGSDMQVTSSRFLQFRKSKCLDHRSSSFILPGLAMQRERARVAGIERQEACDHASRDACVPGMMVVRATLSGWEAGRRQRPDSRCWHNTPVLPDGSTQIRKNSRRPSRCFYCAWGCFSVFVSAQLIAGTDMIGAVSL